ncbi:MAG: 4Fe-4S ferredoxin [Candidatus Aegiribacteria sp.]|nr:4Fe-4S ferredoxin [Candidatus Aegiribacteria sp.]
MDYRIIKKSKITEYLNNLINEYVIFAPIEKDDIVLYDRIKSGDEVILDYSNSVNSPKEAVIPQLETLISCKNNEDITCVKEHLDEQKRFLLFGARPCDARSLLFLDKVFNDEKCRDVYYMNRRNALTIISLGCTRPQETCFCTTTGGSPFSSEGSDLLFVDIGDDYIIQVITEKGAELVEKLDLENTQNDELTKMDIVINKSKARIEPEMELKILKDKLDSSFEGSAWEILTEKCLSCGICTYHCPTCHCFDMIDEETKGKVERIRLWDSCQFPHFTMQTSGFNPRPTYKERYRQRIMHKFSYCFDNYNMAGCVGCGRCVSQCPVNLDIRQVLTAFYGKHEEIRL